jgi:hypothetical protein
MLKFLINLRNYFYTQSPEPDIFGYKFSMSVLFTPYYFIVLSVVDILLRNLTGFRITDYMKHEHFLERVLKAVVFWIPLAIPMFFVSSFSGKYDRFSG